MHFLVQQDERRERDLLYGVSLDETEDTLRMKDMREVNEELKRKGAAAELNNQHQNQEEVQDDVGTPV